MLPQDATPKWNIRESELSLELLLLPSSNSMLEYSPPSWRKEIAVVETLYCPCFLEVLENRPDLLLLLLFSLLGVFALLLNALADFDVFVALLILNRMKK